MNSTPIKKERPMKSLIGPPSNLSDPRIDSKAAGYKHHGGTAPQATSQSFPATEDSDPPKPVSNRHTGPLHPHPAALSSTPPLGSSQAPCRCCPADTAPPAAGS